MFRDLLHQLKASYHTGAGYMTGSPTPWGRMKVGAEALQDRMVDSVYGKTIGTAGRMTMGFLGLAGVVALGAGMGAMAVGETAVRVAGRVAFGGFGAAGGVTGIAGNIAATVGGLGTIGLQAASMGERVFRGAMTGSPIGAFTRRGFLSSNPIESYFPFAKHSFEKVGIAKYAPNPSIFKRGAVAMVAVGGLKAFAGELFSPSAPAPSIYVDAEGNTRHKNDWGANANFAASMMGNNSDFNLSRNDILRAAMYM